MESASVLAAWVGLYFGYFINNEADAFHFMRATRPPTCQQTAPYPTRLGDIRFVRHMTLVASLWGMVWSTVASAEVPRPVFYLPLDGSTVASIAVGSAEPIRRDKGNTDTILELLSHERERFTAGRVGLAIDIRDEPLVFEAAGNFRGDEGTASFWVNPSWSGDNRSLYSTLFGVADWGMVYKYEDQTGLTFGTARPDKDLYYDCGGGDIRAWRPDEWHHVAVTWSRQQNARRFFVDGQLRGSGLFPFARDVKSGPVFVGAGCTLYPDPVARAKIDEFALWDRPLDGAAVSELFALGQAGKPLIELPSSATPVPGNTLRPVPVHAPPPPEPNNLVEQAEGPRTVVSLNGWWSWLSAGRELEELPTTGWGLSRVPGYWTAPHSNVPPDDAANDGGRWLRSLSKCWVTYYQRSFTAQSAWQSQHVLLQLDGVDGLAEVYVNDQRIGWLGAWESESFDVTSQLHYGAENTVTIVLRTRGGAKQAGIFGDVALCVLKGPMLHDVSLRPLVEKRQIEISATVWSTGLAMDGRIEVDVRAKCDPQQVIRHFVCPVKAAAAPRQGAALGPELQKASVTCDWPDAHMWNVNDPFLYEATATLLAEDTVVDALPGQTFGFREFTQRGADFYLNGTPCHLRGHQIDLAWPDQLARVKELKAAGMNALELSGPISSSWYNGTPVQADLFEDILNYCDENGLIAVPILPDPPLLRDRIFDPAVARLYRQRVEKHIRKYGNHACIGMWYMNFNLSGYHWYVAPSKLDGSYKPDEAAVQARERFSLEAQRIAQSVDARPIYHHACGNFGDVFTSNLYLGPNSPTQEREEWPSAWAAKRPFPFMACEHCCMLIPYWFRPREFPLSVVYAGEPIFDEISAMYLGARAYTQITDEVFDLYDIGRTPRDGRTQSLIRHHACYQETKSQIARDSLRAWRTWGVSGIIFNAENWDFQDDSGHALPMKQAFAQYFGDTDLYLAGPGSDWPSKDHCYFAGETFGKQAVLLNDLARDLPVNLTWSLQDAAGRVVDSGRIKAVAKAGSPTFCPIECVAPSVERRAEFRLVIDPDEPARHFQQASFALQVFPRHAASSGTSLLLYDPVGDTGRMLQRAGARFTPLTAASQLPQESLLVVGRRAFDQGFLALAEQLHLDQAIRDGVRILVLEQTEGQPMGLRLEETSTRLAFAADPGHVALTNLQSPDWRDLRGQSDLIAPYPDAPPETRLQWPARCFKWSNRGIVATYVYRKPHYSPFRPVLECGFDLVQSPLLEARFGRGRVVLCQVDVTPRYGVDPVSTQIVDNLLCGLSEPSTDVQRPCSFLGESARAFMARFGVEPQPWPGDARGVVVVGRESLRATQVEALEQAARQGATILLLPGAPHEVGQLQTRDEELFLARPSQDPLCRGANAGDFYLKARTKVPCVLEQGGWRNLTLPGVLAEKTLGSGRIVTCTLNPDDLDSVRGRIKALRVWNLLLTNLDVDRNSLGILSPGQVYEDNVWENLPPYINW